MITEAIKLKIAQEVSMLRACTSLEAEAALALLWVQYGIVLDSWKGYKYFYFTPDREVYASQFSTSTLGAFEYILELPDENVENLLNEFLGNFWKFNLS
jgi:hypothetical protein